VKKRIEALGIGVAAPPATEATCPKCDFGIGYCKCPGPSPAPGAAERDILAAWDSDIPKHSNRTMPYANFADGYRLGHAARAAEVEGYRTAWTKAADIAAKDGVFAVEDSIEGIAEGYSLMLSHRAAEVERLRAIARKVTHCDNCGGQWYDDGNNASHYCAEIARLREELATWKEDGERHDAADCKRGALCPYCEIARLRREQWTPADGFWIVKDDGASRSRVSDVPLGDAGKIVAAHLDEIAAAIEAQRRTQKNSSYDIALAIVAAIRPAAEAGKDCGCAFTSFRHEENCTASPAPESAEARVEKALQELQERATSPEPLQPSYRLGLTDALRQLRRHFPKGGAK